MINPFQSKHLLSPKIIVFLAIIAIGLLLVILKYQTATYGPSYPPDNAMANNKEALFKIVHSMNPFASKLFRSDLEGIPVFDVELSRRNIKYINEVIARGLDPNKNVYRPAGEYISVGDNNYTEETKTKVSIDGGTHKAKIKIHGVWHPNFRKKKKSYSIKFKKDQLFDNMRKVSFAVPEKQFLGGLIAHEISEKYGYIKAGYGIARLKFNGIDQGLYFLEETLGKELLEKNGLSGYEVIKSMDEWSHQYRSSHYMPTIYDLSYRDYKNISGRENGQLLLYDELMHSRDYERIVNRIDIDKFARHEAMRTLFASYHCIEGDNLALVLNTASGRFFPYFRPEGFLGRLKSGSLNQSFDQYLYGRYNANGKIYSENPLFSTLIKNNEFRTLRNHYLYELVKDRAYILDRMQNLKAAYQTHIENDFTNNYSLPYYRYRSHQQSQDLSYNLSAASKYLEYARVHASIVQISPTRLKLNIKPDSNSPLMISELLLEGLEPQALVTFHDLQTDLSESVIVAELGQYFSQKQFMVDLDDHMQPRVTSFNFTINLDTPAQVTAMQLAFKNVTTGKAVKEKNVFLQSVRQPPKFNLGDNLSATALEASGLRNFSIEDMVITLSAGRSAVTEDIVFPYGYALYIKAGAIIELAPATSMLVNGSLKVDGSEQQPVIIRNLEKSKPFGVFAAVGDSYTKVEVQGLDISGGNEDMINGMFLSGALSLYNHASVSLRNSHIHHNRADDGLNVKEAAIDIQNNIFSNNYADQVDIDVATGTILNNRFLADYPLTEFDHIDIPVDSNGDGLDFSGSRVLVRGNTFKGFKDKGISIGERTQVLVHKNKFEENRSAITAKDQSDVFLCANKIDLNSNDIILEGYQKKSIFKSPSIYDLCEEIPLAHTSLTKQTRFYMLPSNTPVDDGFLSSDFSVSLFDFLSKMPWELQPN